MMMALFVATVILKVSMPSLLSVFCDDYSITTTAAQPAQSSRRLLRLVVSQPQQEQHQQQQQQQQQQKRSSLLTLQESISNLRDAGFDLCLDLRKDNENHHEVDIDVSGLLLQHCTDYSVVEDEAPTSISFLDRRLVEEEEEENDSNVDEIEKESPEDFLFNILGALACVSMAALAAGLTLGLLGLDPLLLLIKQRASVNEQERIAAADLLPIVKDHHRLLVTLLLLNSVSNEALPIFLEGLHLAPWIAILISVTLVLFFGEIFPSAIFTGPHQMTIAHKLLPLVKMAMFLLYPLAMPIAHLLDCWLHHDGGAHGGGDGDGVDDNQADGDAYYNRGELSAMIRILYEERLEAKRRRKEHRREVQRLQVQRDGFLFKGDRVGALDFTLNSSFHSADHRDSIRAAISRVEHTAEHHISASTTNGILEHHAHPRAIASVKSSIRGDDDASHKLGGAASNSIYEQPDVKRTNSIHLDEVMMVEGALQMKTKVRYVWFCSFSVS
jgi:Cyclin M transmembrane N-terminal domain